MHLGVIEHNIKYYNEYSDHHQDLIEIGIDVNFLNSSKNPIFQSILLGFETYKKVHNIVGKFDIPPKFIVPLNNCAWPEKTWLMNLASIQSSIRNQYQW